MISVATLQADKSQFHLVKHVKVVWLLKLVSLQHADELSGEVENVKKDLEKQLAALQVHSTEIYGVAGWVWLVLFVRI